MCLYRLLTIKFRAISFICTLKLVQKVEQGCNTGRSHLQATGVYGIDSVARAVVKIKIALAVRTESYEEIIVAAQRG